MNIYVYIYICLYMQISTNIYIYEYIILFIYSSVIAFLLIPIFIDIPALISKCILMFEIKLKIIYSYFLYYTYINI